MIGATWDETKGKWNVAIKDLSNDKTVNDSCHVLINAGGILNAWRWPAIPGLKDFKGALVHSAAWDPALDLKGKHIGLIGNGLACLLLQ